MNLPESPYTYAFGQPSPPLGFNPIHSIIKHLIGRPNELTNTRERLESSGIAGGQNPGYPWGGHSDVLSRMLVDHPYNTDPHVQAKFLAMLKQLGYLRHQAY